MGFSYGGFVLTSQRNHLNDLMTQWSNKIATYFQSKQKC